MEARNEEGNKKEDLDRLGLDDARRGVEILRASVFYNVSHVPA